VPINTAKDFVIGPLQTLPSPPSAVATWTSASVTQQTSWTAAYAKALDKAPGNDPSKVAKGSYGPVPAITGGLLAMARQGSLDSALVSGGTFYNANYTKAVLFMGDGGYLKDLATGLHLSGDQWGMMNETGNYPGQSWLWLFSAFYQIEPFKSAPNADILVVLMVAIPLGTAILIALAGGRLGREPLEAAEQPAKVLRRQACALIGDANDGVVALVGDSHGDLAADLRIFDGVADEVRGHLY